MLCQRFSGCLRMHRETIRTNSRGRPEASAESGAGSVVRIAAKRRNGRLSLEGAARGEHLVEQRAEREDVRAVIHRLAFGLLGRHVRDGAHDRALNRLRALGQYRLAHIGGAGGAGHQLGKAEVEHLDAARVAHHHVARLEIAVNDTRGVGRCQRVGDLDAACDCRVQRQRFPADHLVEGLALDQLHRDEVAVACLRDLVDRDDVRVVQRRGRLRFLNEASPLLLGLSLASVVRGQELQRGAPVQQDVAGLVDHAHSAFPELFLDFVVADGAPGHRRES